jgi:hypothetical protein
MAMIKCRNCGKNISDTEKVCPHCEEKIEKKMSCPKCGNEDLDFSIIGKSNVYMCKSCGNGWGTCFSAGKCVLQDDFAEVYEAFQRAEAIVLVTPVYWHDMSENMKALLDRMRRCEPFTNHYMEDKRCMLVACAGGTGRGAVKCLRTMEETLGHMKMVPLERLPIIRFNKEYMLPALFHAGEMFARHYSDWK